MKSNSRFLVLIIIAFAAWGIWSLRGRVRILPTPEASAESNAITYSESRKSVKLARPAPPPAPREAFNEKRAEKSLAVFSREKAYCEILKSGAGIPLDGQLRISAYEYQVDDEKEPGFVAYIQSTVCPDGLFSKVRMQANGKVKEVFDCRSTPREKLLLNSGVQGNVIEKLSDDESINFAISGPGYFVLDCGGDFYLSRSGEFQRQGNEVMQGSCHVLARDGSVFETGDLTVDHRGCDSKGKCVALVQPDPQVTSFVERGLFRVEGEPLKNLLSSEAGYIFHDALEDWSDPETGPEGPNWDSVPEFFPPAVCS